MAASMLWIWLGGPVALLVAGLRAVRAVDTNLRRRTRAVQRAAGLNLAVAALGVVWMLVAGPLRTPLLGANGVGLSLYLDRLSGLVYLLVSLIGWRVVGFSRNYLDGEAGQGRFFGWMAGALSAVLLVIASGNLLGLTLAWVAMSTCLHALLRFYPDRPAAVLAARKKFLVSRLGDACLLAAMVLLWHGAGTLEIAELRVLAGAPTAGLAAVLPVAALLLVTTALLKSAPFPLHGWIAEVMEAPTPVSAFLHAGVINAGGYLVLRHADLIAREPAALHALLLVGGVTALFGSVAMLPQTSIKGALAHSTIAQMGFMMLECGLGACPAAALHLVAHAAYKAHAFLSAGSAIERTRAFPEPGADGQPHPLRILLAVLIAPLIALGVGHLFGARPGDAPGVLALGVILLFGLVTLIAHALDERPRAFVVGGALVLAGAVAAAYFTLQAAMAFFLRDALPTRAALHDGGDLLLITVLVAVFGAFTVLQCLLPHAPDRPFWRALHAHVAGGLYVNTWVNRWMLRWWPGTPVPTRAAVSIPRGCDA